MSAFYIKQKVSFKEKYLIYDFNEEPILQVMGSQATLTLDRLFGSIFSVGHTIKISTLDGENKSVVHRKPGFIWKKYDILIDKNKVASIAQNKNLIVPKMHVNGDCGEILITGDILGKNFSMVKDNINIAQVSKKFLSMGDIYKVDILEEHMDNLVIAIVIALDNCFHS